MYYSEELHVIRPQDFDDMSVTPVDVDAAVGAKKTLTLTVPAAPLYFGFQPTTAFVYDTATTIGVLALYKYPNGSAAAKVLLAEIDLEDAAALHTQYMVKVPQYPPNTTSHGKADAPVADCKAQDQLVVYIKTQGNGGSYLVGAFQPVLVLQHRGFSLAEETAWEDRTPASSGIPSAS